MGRRIMLYQRASFRWAEDQAQHLELTRDMHSVSTPVWRHVVVPGTSLPTVARA